MYEGNAVHSRKLGIFSAMGIVAADIVPLADDHCILAERVAQMTLHAVHHLSLASHNIYKL